MAAAFVACESANASSICMCGLQILVLQNLKSRRLGWQGNLFRLIVKTDFRMESLPVRNITPLNVSAILDDLVGVRGKREVQVDTC
jgi:hypothetical protein